MTKYVVIKTNGRVEFTTSEAAQNYFETNEDCISVETFDEQEGYSTIHVEIAMWRLRAVLILTGLQSIVDSAIDALPEPDRIIARMGYDHGNTIDRNSPIVIGIQQALNLTPQQVDNLFIEAQQIKA